MGVKEPLTGIVKKSYEVEVSRGIFTHLEIQDDGKLVKISFEGRHSINKSDVISVKYHKDTTGTNYAETYDILSENEEIVLRSGIACFERQLVY